MSKTPGRCHCGATARTDGEWAGVCTQWPLCEKNWLDVTDPLTEPCAACNAEAGEPCRPGCLGHALDNDLLNTETLED